jgi:membrane-associated phospholipid phosphatase
MATLIGAARVYAGVHYPLDILGGAVLGILSPILVRNLLPKPMVRATTPAEPEPTA